jgi:hypothetical protein
VHVLEIAARRRVGPDAVHGDAVLALDMIAGAMIYRLLLGGIEPEALPDRARKVLDTLLEGLRPR